MNKKLIESFIQNHAIPIDIIGKETGVSLKRLNSARDGLLSVDELSTEELEKIDCMIKETGYRVSVDYSELIEELTHDKFEGLIGERVIVERTMNELVGRPIPVDYYFSIGEVPIGVKTSLESYDDLMKELDDLNRIV